MATSMIGGAGSVSSSNALSTLLTQEDFLRVMLTQLRAQDPMKPMDNQQFMAQLASFSSLELSRQMNENIELLLQAQSSSQALGLIGKTVEVSSSGGNVIGKVTTLSFQDGRPVMTVQPESGNPLTGVALDMIRTIRDSTGT